jgi:hypothetical protein
MLLRAMGGFAPCREVVFGIAIQAYLDKRIQRLVIVIERGRLPDLPKE